MTFSRLIDNTPYDIQEVQHLIAQTMDGGLGVDAAGEEQEDSTAQPSSSPSQTHHAQSSPKNHRRLKQLENRKRWRESRREAREPEDAEAAELLAWIKMLERPARIERVRSKASFTKTPEKETPTDRSLYVFTDFFQAHASPGRRFIFVSSRPTIPSPDVWDTMTARPQVERPPREESVCLLHFRPEIFKGLHPDNREDSSNLQELMRHFQDACSFLNSRASKEEGKAPQVAETTPKPAAVLALLLAGESESVQRLVRSQGGPGWKGA
ncbi:hypothetical protein QBC34DRAFT_406932, partial [Podospora aff. communis PSN243]